MNAFHHAWGVLRVALRNCVALVAFRLVRSVCLVSFNALRALRCVNSVVFVALQTLRYACYVAHGLFRLISFARIGVPRPLRAVSCTMHCARGVALFLLRVVRVV